MEAFAVFAVFIGVLAVGFVMASYRSPPEPAVSTEVVPIMVSYWEREREQSRRKAEAWRWWRALNGLYVADLEANPPASTLTIHRGTDGRWYASEYDGVRVDVHIYHFGRFDLGPPSGPVGYHSWRTIGEAGGFLFREQAEAFLSAHMRETQTEFEFVPLKVKWTPQVVQPIREDQ